MCSVNIVFYWLTGDPHEYSNFIHPEGVEVEKAAMSASQIFSALMLRPFVIRAEAELKYDCSVNSKKHMA